jgi:hypothetical protein
MSKNELDSTLDPIQRPSTVPRESEHEDGTGFDQLREYNKNAYGEISILKQSRSDFITTGLISAEARNKELKEIEVLSNEIVSKVHTEKEKSIRYMTLQEILTNTSDACISIITELTSKPKSTSWGEYIQVVLTKDDRYMYVGILLVVLSIWIYLLRL